MVGGVVVITIIITANSLDHLSSLFSLCLHTPVPPAKERALLGKGLGICHSCSLLSVISV